MGRSTNDERIDQLRSIWLFERCTDRELERVARIATPLCVEAGRRLAREGERGGEFFVIVEGEAVVSLSGAPLATAGAGSFLGEISMLDGRPRTATVTALSRMLLLVFDRREFDDLVDAAMPSVARRMLTVAAERLRSVDRRLATTHALPRGPVAASA
jgi:CRP/FNR family transcriptional regulator, cyclic AMP receptor protein